MKNEPVLTAITALILATFALAASFGLEFSSEQVAGVVGWVVAAYGIGVVVRSHVTPVR